MTYSELFTLIESLLIRDVKFTKVCEERALLVQAALERVATEATTQYLSVVNPYGVDILRKGLGTSFIRFPVSKAFDNNGVCEVRNGLVEGYDIVDIDKQLYEAVARYVCSSISDLKKTYGRFDYHASVGDRIIRRFNENIYSHIESMAQYGEGDHLGQTDQVGRLII